MKRKCINHLIRVDIFYCNELCPVMNALVKRNCIYIAATSETNRFMEMTLGEIYNYPKSK